MREPWKVDDARKNYDFAIRCLREQCIRSGAVAPHPGDAREERWAKEGPVTRLETVRAP